MDLMIERGISKKIKWDTPNGLRADTLDEPLLLKMKEAGASLIYVSPESGSQRVVNEVIKKNLDLKRVEDAVRICQKIGLRIGCFFVIGLPGETKSEIEETVAFAKKLRELGAMTFARLPGRRTERTSTRYARTTDTWSPTRRSWNWAYSTPRGR